VQRSSIDTRCRASSALHPHYAVLVALPHDWDGCGVDEVVFEARDVVACFDDAVCAGCVLGACDACVGVCCGGGWFVCVVVCAGGVVVGAAVVSMSGGDLCGGGCGLLSSGGACVSRKQRDEVGATSG